MGLARVVLSSRDTDWRTPDSLFARLNLRYRFGLDAAASEESTKCPTFLGPEADALTKSWGGHGSVFLNPPYRRGWMGKWLGKARAEAIAHGIHVVCLIPSRTGAGWWHRYVLQQGEQDVAGVFCGGWASGAEMRLTFTEVIVGIEFIRGRVAFERPGVDNGAPFDSALVVFLGVCR